MKTGITLLLVFGLVLPFVLAIAQEAPEKRLAPEPGAGCGACHAKPEMGNQWGAWKRSPHARSFSALGGEAAKAVAKRAGVEGDPREAGPCLSCHAPMAEHREMGVSCEVCHGPGREYAGVCGESFAKAVEKGLQLPGERDCLVCHRASPAHPDLDFDFVVDFEEVAHPRPRRDREAELFSTEGLYTKWEIFTEEDGLPHHMVFGVTPHGDDVWFATEDGVARLRDGKFESWHEKDGLPHPAATQVAVDPKTGEVWVSTLAGIAVFDGKGKWTAYTQENSGLINNCTFGITIWGDDVWIATFDGIGRYDRKAKKWYKYYLHNAPLEEVWTYGTEAAPHKVNFAVWGGGLVEYFPEDDHWEAHHDPDGSFEMNLIKSDGVISQMTTSVSYDNGWTWVASYFGGSAYNGRSWIEMDMDDSGMPSNFVNFVKARRNQGWFCMDRGLACLDLDRDRWVWYRKLTGPGDYGEIIITDREGKKRRSIVTESAIPFNFVWGVAFQGEDIWVATSDGVARGRY